jgi:hypothetical protein
MKISITTETGSNYNWDVNARTITHDAPGDSGLHCAAWRNVSLVKVANPTVGKRWEFTGWPGQIRCYSDGREVFSPFAASRDDTMLTSRITEILLAVNGTFAHVPSIEVLVANVTANA